MKKIAAVVLIAALICACAMAEGIGTRMKVVKCNEWITLREDPSKKADSLSRMGLGEENLVLLSEDHGDFARISYNGKVGYALKEYLEPAESFEGEKITLAENQRYNVNLFLSNFSEQCFAVPEGAYIRGESDPRMEVDFAINHIWFNKENQLEWGEWGEYNVRLPANKVNATAEKYLEKSIRDQNSNHFMLYEKYYYWTETGGHTNDGFVSCDLVEQLDENRVGVYFHVYGSGEKWKNDVCYLRPDEIGEKYWSSLQGHAVINLDGGDLYDRSSWYLERYAVTEAE